MVAVGWAGVKTRIPGRRAGLHAKNRGWFGSGWQRLAAGVIIMTGFEDGPAAGQVLDLRRAPLFLRVAVSGTGTVDALDQIDDRPEASEVLWAYRRLGPAGRVRIDGRDPRTGRRTSASLALAKYRLVADQPDQETMRATTTWRAWATATAGRGSAGESGE
jgi:hypothetical protein